MAIKFDYDAPDDVLYICDAIKRVKESIEFSEDIVLDLDKDGRVIGVELFYASQFLNLFNKEINQQFLISLENADLEYKEYRNMRFIVLLLKSGNKEIRQPLPPLLKSEYISPLLANC